MVGLKSKFNMQKFVETFTQQSRTHQKHNSDGQLNDNEVRAKLPPEGSRGASSALGQPIAQVCQRQPQYRGYGKQDSSQQRNRDREHHQMEVHPNACEVRHIRAHVLRKQTQKDLNGAIGQEDTKQSASQHKNQRLRHELARQPRPRCPQCASHRDLAFTRFRPNQKKARHIDARNRQ